MLLSAGGREAVDAAHPLGDPDEIAHGFSTLAELRLAEGDLSAARAAIEGADELAPDVERRVAHVAGWVRDTLRAMEAAEAG